MAVTLSSLSVSSKLNGDEDNHYDRKGLLSVLDSDEEYDEEIDLSTPLPDLSSEQEKAFQLDPNAPDSDNGHDESAVAQAKANAGKMNTIVFFCSIMSAVSVAIQ